ncbi:hypothetical protein [Flavitalea sp.]|nr:hypothetical protein [Flavitalea sp.]
MAATEVQGLEVVFQYSTDLIAPYDWKTIGCETDNSSDSQATVNDTVTKCATFSSASKPTNAVSGNGVVNAAPEADEASYKEIDALLQNQTKARGRYLNLDNGTIGDGEAIYKEGEGRFTSLGHAAPADNLLTFSWGFSFSGVVITTPAS